MKAPIVLITFNRPLLTKQVFNVISKAKPSVLFLISDGPRNGAERKLVEETRQIISLIDWPCKVFRKYSDVNLGCKISVSSGLDWVFSRADRAIILEDDCVPDPSFFTFCDDLLDKYEDNPKIMHITGSFLLGNNSVSKDSYYFSHFTSVWGWATWRRAWTKYDVAIKDWQNNSQIVLNQTLKDRRSRDFMNKRFE